MSPVDIVSTAKNRGLNAIALSDHNSALNCPALAEVCAREGLVFFPAIEVCTIEEAHILCLFETIDDALSVSHVLYDLLPEFLNDPEKLGDQLIVNAQAEIEGEVEKYLGQHALISINHLVKLVHSKKGLVIPAHVDKPVFSVPSQLGFLDDNEYDAVEVSYHFAHAENPYWNICRFYPRMSNSDAHYLADIGKVYCEFDCTELTFSALREAIREKRLSIGFS